MTSHGRAAVKRPQFGQHAAPQNQTGSVQVTSKGTGKHVGLVGGVGRKELAPRCDFSQGNG